MGEGVRRPPHVASDPCAAARHQLQDPRASEERGGYRGTAWAQCRDQHRSSDPGPATRARVRVAIPPAIA